MRETTCPRLKILIQVLVTAYRHRTSAVKDGNSFQKLRADENLANVHNLISKHRNTCQDCKAIEAARHEANLRLRASSQTFGKVDQSSL